MSRSDFLAFSAALVGIAALGGCGGSDDGARRLPLGDEPGDLLVFDWAGYDNANLWRPYDREFPDQKPRFAFQETNDQAFARVASGFSADVSHPDVDYFKDWVDQDLIEQWDTTLLSNFSSLNPTLSDAGVIDGKQFWIPADWGFAAPLYRADKVEPSEDSWNLLFDDRYSGKISWWDSLYMLVVAGYFHGFDDPYDMSDAELETAKQTLIDKKSLVRRLWITTTDLLQDIEGGNIWIAYAWPDAWLGAKSKGLDVVYMTPKEGKLSWSGGYVLRKDSENFHHAHKFVDAWISPTSGEWLVNNFAYGHSSTALDLARLNKEAVAAFELTDPSAIEEPGAHLSRWMPRRSAYGSAWTEIKAA